jgi:tetratricopeptide (TPR) repeat protein
MEPYPNVIDPGTRGDVGTQSIEALKLYEQGNYAAALKSFDEYLHLNPNDLESRFYYGISALMKEEFDIAERELQSVSNSDSRLSNQATWYLALARINTNKIGLAKENLNTLIEGQSSYAVKAGQIMKKL